ncbi:arabinofuranosyltransferase AftA [Gordonia spumicola]|uniref:Galactan 5-O-arabinofuranosyltransferase n=1 Tax=Gordonia spumicola TaxID=589161 RepID=A0A7I9V4Q8_9ACTN|nr:arabinofuranosyltransferase [Gordonia spumicola]GEE00415.1 arabinofuranosyltransferase AftA [Gordonia spumicola]
MLKNRRLRDVVELGGAAVLAAIVAYIGLKVIGAVGWPAFNTSNVTRALTTLGQGVTVVLAAVAVVAYRYGRSPLVTSLLSSVSSALLVTVTLGMPLGASKLYLGGLSVDQQFRTEYLTRLTDSPSLADMTYHGLPPYYPASWFWFGGRFASLTGLPGWEAYKPWAILSLAVAAALGTALWNRMVGVGVGTAVGLATTAVTIVYASPEPYSATLILVGVPMMVVAASAIRGRGRLADGPSPIGGTSWLAVVAVGLFLGVSATVYTLYTALFAGTVVLIAIGCLIQAFLAGRNRAADFSSDTRAVHLAVIARLGAVTVVAGLVALLTWAPYLVKRLSTTAPASGNAEHYLPDDGAIVGLPMFQVSLIGVLTMIGLVWVLLRARQRTIAAAFGYTLIGVLGLTGLSLALTAVGTTLLSFRLQPVTAVVLAAGGVFGVVELSRLAVKRFGDVRTVIGVLAAVVAIAFTQAIPSHLSGEITTAYTDTDGYGKRADQHPAGAESYYPEIHRLIREQTGRPANQNVVLTADFGFLSIYPYWGFQGLTSHYANPLAEFDKRAAAIEAWSTATTPSDLMTKMSATPWRKPDVFLFRYSPDGYTLRLAKDVFPNDPNVSRYTVTFSPAVFADPAFTVTEVGPFVLVVRKA